MWLSNNTEGRKKEYTGVVIMDKKEDFWDEPADWDILKDGLYIQEPKKKNENKITKELLEHIEEIYERANKS